MAILELIVNSSACVKKAVSVILLVVPVMFLKIPVFIMVISRFVTFYFSVSIKKILKLKHKSYATYILISYSINESNYAFIIYDIKVLLIYCALANLIVILVAHCISKCYNTID